MGKLLDDERFRHVDYRHTDLWKTFARERKRLADEAKAKADAKVNVLQIQRKAKETTK